MRGQFSFVGEATRQGHRPRALCHLPRHPLSLLMVRMLARRFVVDVLRGSFSVSQRTSAFRDLKQDGRPALNRADRLDQQRLPAWQSCQSACRKRCMYSRADTYGRDSSGCKCTLGSRGAPCDGCGRLPPREGQHPTHSANKETQHCSVGGSGQYMDKIQLPPPPHTPVARTGRPGLVL